MPDPTETKKKPELALDAIIAVKLFKGLLFVAIAFGFYALSDNDLNLEYSQLLRYLHIDGSRKFFLNLAAKVAQVKETDVLWVAAGTLVYGLLSLTEATGLILRHTWAATLTAAESGFLIPFEIYELFKHFSLTVFIVLILNVIIVWYLLHNRHRLFHHLQLPAKSSAATTTLPPGE